MTPAEWLEHTRADAERRNLPGTIPVLESIARAIEMLRAAAWNDNLARADADERDSGGDESR
jgi:hypothetical protein